LEWTGALGALGSGCRDAGCVKDSLSVPFTPMGSALGSDSGICRDSVGGGASGLLGRDRSKLNVIWDGLVKTWSLCPKLLAQIPRPTTNSTCFALHSTPHFGCKSLPKFA
jgi:hypothetical protein